LGEADYNDIFERLVETDGDGETHDLAGFLAYGFYKIAKREWAMGIREKHQRGPTSDELAAYIATWTQSRIDGLFENAQSTLGAYAEQVIDDEAPSIKEDAITEKIGEALADFRRGSKITFKSGLYTFVISMLGAASWTAIVYLVFICLQAAGVDILNIAGSASKHAG